MHVAVERHFWRVIDLGRMAECSHVGIIIISIGRYAFVIQGLIDMRRCCCPITRTSFDARAIGFRSISPPIPVLFAHVLIVAILWGIIPIDIHIRWNSFWNVSVTMHILLMVFPFFELIIIGWIISGYWILDGGRNLVSYPTDSSPLWIMPCHCCVRTLERHVLPRIRTNHE